eukprot:TRINITY_DN8006_c0_g1_i3.p1 TRINITY_DN8006_c0_g1~~TRINITY_DN8006_c0_g1_i3.p1  ORF type:complete len:1119 (+),score=204.81 TRINITY_DN8006_c0_g1_i3:84-3359(+)
MGCCYSTKPAQQQAAAPAPPPSARSPQRGVPADSTGAPRESAGAAVPEAARTNSQPNGAGGPAGSATGSDARSKRRRSSLPAGLIPEDMQDNVALGTAEREDRRERRSAFRSGYAGAPCPPEWSSAAEDDIAAERIASLRAAHQRGAEARAAAEVRRLSDSGSTGPRRPSGLTKSSVGPPRQGSGRGRGIGSAAADSASQLQRSRSARSTKSSVPPGASAAVEQPDGGQAEGEGAALRAAPPEHHPAAVPPPLAPAAELSSPEAAPAQPARAAAPAVASAPEATSGGAAHAWAAEPAGNGHGSSVTASRMAELERRLLRAEERAAEAERRATAAAADAARASAAAPQHPARHTEGAVVQELRSGLGIYTVATPLADPGTRYQLRNDSARGAVVTLSFAGSHNIHCEVPPEGEAAGVSLCTGAAGEVEAVAEVRPRQVVVMCDVHPADDYAPWTVAVAGRWRVLAATDHEPSPPASPPQQRPKLAAPRAQSPESAAALSGSGSSPALRGDGRRGEPFVDGDMPSADGTLPGVAQWRRAEERYSAPLHECLQPTGCPVRGSSWLAGALGVLRDAAPQALESLYPLLLGERPPAEGAVEAWWCPQGWWTRVVTDSLLPFEADRITPAGVSGDGAAWPALAAKTYAKALGGYDRIPSGGQPGHLFSDATGCPYQKVPLSARSGGADNVVAMWEYVSEHHALGHPVVLGVASEDPSSQAGDCDADSASQHRRGRERLPAELRLPPGGCAALTALRPAADPLHAQVLLRLAGGDEWATFADAIAAFDSVTVCVLTRGWADLRVRCRAVAAAQGGGCCLDTLAQVSVPAPVRAHLWLGAAQRRAAAGCRPTALVVLSPAPDGRYAVSEPVFGVEQSSQVWGEVVLEPSQLPHVVVPLVYGCAPGEEFRLAMRFSDVGEGAQSPQPNRSPSPGDGHVRLTQLHSSTLEEVELMLAEQWGEAKSVADRVSLHMHQQFRWLGCCARNAGEVPCAITVDFARSEGYTEARCGAGSSRAGHLRYRCVVPPGGDARLVCALVASGDEWAYQVEAQCEWLHHSAPCAPGGPPVDVALSEPSCPRLVQYNGETLTAEVLSFSVALQ